LAQRVPQRPPKTESSGLGWDAWLPESVNTRTLSDKPRADLSSVSRTEATLVQELQGTLRNESDHDLLPRNVGAGGLEIRVARAPDACAVEGISSHKRSSRTKSGY
jgi:hypothetical protein